MWFRESADSEAAHGSITVGTPMRVGLVITAAAMILIFVLPGPLLDWAEQGAVDLMRTPGAVIGAVTGR